MNSKFLKDLILWLDWELAVWPNHLW
jgi:hypothetical protein